MTKQEYCFSEHDINKAIKLFEQYYSQEFSAGSTEEKIKKTKSMCKFLFDVCFRTKNRDEILSKPNLKFKDIAPFYGQYDDKKNIIDISSSLVERVATNVDSVVSIEELLDTIAHELQHFDQNCDVLRIENSQNVQGDFDEERLTTARSINVCPEISTEGVEELFKIFQKPEIPKQYKDAEKFYDDYSHAFYYTSPCEIKAREEGCRFTLSFLNKMIEKLLAEKSGIAQTTLEMLQFQTEYARKMHKRNIKQTERYKKLLKFCDFSKFDVFSVVEMFNNSSRSYREEWYAEIIEFLIINNTYQKNIELFKTALEKDYFNFAYLLMKTIERDKILLASKQKISKQICDIFVDKISKMSGHMLIFGTALEKFPVNLLMRDDQLEILYALVSNNAYDAMSFCKLIPSINFTPDEISLFYDILSEKSFIQSIHFFSNVFTHNVLNLDQKLNVYTEVKDKFDIKTLNFLASAITTQFNLKDRPAECLCQVNSFKNDYKKRVESHLKINPTFVTSVNLSLATKEMWIFAINKAPKYFIENIDEIPKSYYTDENFIKTLPVDVKNAINKNEKTKDDVRYNFQKKTELPKAKKENIFS